ncbi:MAG TPA: lipid II flippase MurJ [Terracidiphilus sp.]|nr:lipid II flippase MurJ [Terracidiphilus sp.]
MTGPLPTEPSPSRESRWARGLGILRPSHTHSAYTASILLAASSFLSSFIGLGRGKFIAWRFGAGPQTDAYVAAFRLPDLMNNFLVGGAVGITFVTILNHYRERGEEAEGERLLFSVLNLMVMVLTAATFVLMLLAGPFIRFTNKGFTPEQVLLCAHMTRILLPAQIFLFAGSVMGATLLVRKQFMYQALQPIVYNLCIIAGGLFLVNMGVSGLAVGATAGFLLGSFALNWWGAARAGVRYRWGIDLHHPGVRMWLHMTLPLMFGFGLPFLDQYFAGYYASGTMGAITRLNNAKQLFAAPMSMLAQAAGVASLPFFSQLWAKGKRFEFAVGVADSVSRVVALGLLASSAMIALAHPIVGLIFGGGRFTPTDVRQTSLFFALYTLSLFLWSAQAIYARSFYAAGITWLPMLASTIILLVAFPFYGLGNAWFGTAGLAMASDAGIALQAVTLALLLHQRRMVSLASLDYAEMGRCLIAGVAGGLVVWAALWGLGNLPIRWLHSQQAAQIRWADLGLVIMGCALWAVVAKWVLERSGSALPKVAMKRLGLG